MSIAKPPVVLFKLWEAVMCPICLSPYHQTTSTICHHSFCLECITQSLKHLPQCPLCKTPCTQAQLFKNFQIDDFKEILKEEMEKAGESYSTQIMGKGAAASSSASADKRELTPLESIFHKHANRSITSMQLFHDEMIRKFEASKKRVMDKYNEQSNKLARDGGLSSDALEKQQRALRTECEHKLARLAQSQEESMRTLLQSYENYMKSFAASPEMLPLVVCIVLPSKSFRLEAVSLKPHDTLRDIKHLVAEKLHEETGNLITQWSPGNTFVLCKRALLGDDSEAVIISNAMKTYGGSAIAAGAAASSSSSSSSSAAGSASSQGEESSMIALNDPNRPLVLFGAQNKDMIVITGEVTMANDSMAKCFTASFSAATNTTDFFMCCTCKVSWICSECSKGPCHAGHEIKPVIANKRCTQPRCGCAQANLCSLLHCHSSSGNHAEAGRSCRVCVSARH